MSSSEHLALALIEALVRESTRANGRPLLSREAASRLVEAFCEQPEQIPSDASTPTPLSKFTEFEDLLELHYGRATLPAMFRGHLETMRWFLERMEGTRSRQEVRP